MPTWHVSSLAPVCEYLNDHDAADSSEAEIGPDSVGGVMIV
jgi:hypothetical protein